MINGKYWRAALSLTISATIVGCALGTACAQATPPVKLSLDPTGAKSAAPGYFPIQIALKPEKPAGITKEPHYRATPMYGIVHLGNGPNSTYVLAVDEPSDGDYRIYLDKNRNGDLTDDGDGTWKEKKVQQGRTLYGVNEYTLRASWGTPQQETSSGEYGIALYRIVMPNRPMPFVLMFREAARTGKIVLDGKPHSVMLAENDADGMFSKPVDDAGKPIGGGAATRPVWLAIDLNDDGKFSGDEIIDARAPFKLGDKAYEATIAPDGSTIALVPTTRKVAEKPKEPELLKPGAVAPDFAADAWGGGKLHLADVKGKVVILDFWATWCGPCQKSMPHIQKVYHSLQGQDVAVVGVCVWDEVDAYKKWMPEHRSQYTFKFAFDPAGRGNDSIATKLYGVSGIPTTYIIGKDGKVVDAIVGYDDGDTRLEKALEKLGIKVASAQ